jgi:L-threonylcarbamoyladenylate synthase
VARTLQLTDSAGDPVVPVLEQAADLVRRGGVLAMPTETFYGLGADPANATAVRRVAAMKGRADGPPILVLIADVAILSSFVPTVPSSAKLLMERFWPGPLTLVLPAHHTLPVALTGGTGTVGIRQPSLALLRELLLRTGPLTGTSANKTGQPPARTAGEVEAILGRDVDLILDGGPTAGEAPSTVVDATGPIRLLREGMIKRDRLATALGEAGLRLEP